MPFQPYWNPWCCSSIPGMILPQGLCMVWSLPSSPASSCTDWQSLLLSLSLATPVFFLFPSCSRSLLSQGLANSIAFPWKAPPLLLYLSIHYQLTYFSSEKPFLTRLNLLLTNSYSFLASHLLHCSRFTFIYATFYPCHILQIHWELHEGRDYVCFLSLLYSQKVAECIEQNRT